MHTQEYEGNLSFATDTWTSPNHYAYVALTAHFETQGQPIVIVLDVVEVPKVSCESEQYTQMLVFNAKSHTGMNLAVAFVDVLQDFCIDHKILSVTCDNTSNNDTMITELDHMLTKFSPINRTCCFAHILNLVAKSLLKQFDVKHEKKDNNDLNEDEQLLLALAENIDEEELTVVQENDNEDSESEDDDSLEGWVDEVEALTPDEWEQLEESIQPVKKMLVKVTKFWKVITCIS
jgi:hypothetical protein